MNRIRYWWPQATREQRLSQCRAGASIGLSATDLAILLGAPNSSAVSKFCNAYDVTLAGEKFVMTRRRRAHLEKLHESDYGQARQYVPVDKFMARNR